MKKLLLIPSPAIWPLFEYEIDLLQSAIDDNYEIYYSFCKSKYKSCIANKEKATHVFNPFLCQRCENRSTNGLKLLDPQSKVNLLINEKYINFDEFKIITNKVKLLLESNLINIKLIRNIVNIDNSDIYEAALSTLMTTLSDSEPDLRIHNSLFYEYIYEALDTHFFYKKYLKENLFDRIIIFNGRTSRYRPILRLCQNYKLDCEVLEYPELTFDRYLLTKNKYPHDFSNRSINFRNFIDNQTIERTTILNEGERLIKDSINQKENHGIGIINYVSDQLKNKLPENWDENRFNISFFTSSDYENAAIYEYYNDIPGGSQLATIKGLRNLLPNKIKFNIRIHPNLKFKDLNAVAKIENLESENINIIRAKDQIDSYYLALKSNVIITFGSQLSIESAFLGKQVIVFGNSYYSAFNFSKNLNNFNDAAILISNLFEKGINFFDDYNKVKEEACLAMFARKYEGTQTKYLKKDSYYGGKFLINGNESRITINRNIYIITKYLGAPIVLYNLYKTGGFVKILTLLKDLLTKKTITNVKN